MAVLYVGLGLIIIVTNIAIQTIVTIVVTFSGGAIAEGVMGTMVATWQQGIAEDLLMNQAEAPLSRRQPKDKGAGSAGLGVYKPRVLFMNTIIICSMTGISIVIAGTWLDPQLEGVTIAMAAFEKGLPPPSRGGHVFPDGMSCVFTLR